MHIQNIEDAVRELTILIHRKGKESPEVKKFKDEHIKNPVFRKALITQYINQCKNVMGLLRFALDQTLEDEEWIIYLSSELESKLDNYLEISSEGSNADEYSEC